MKKMVATFLFSLIMTFAYAPTSPFLIIEDAEPIRPYEDLWRAVCYYESRNNPLAYNEAEGATGIAQIRQCRVDHFNDLTGKSYSLSDCYDPEVSKEIFMTFALIHRDPEIIARRWNGSGSMTEKYWRNIVAILENDVYI